MRKNSVAAALQSSSGCAVLSESEYGATVGFRRGHAKPSTLCSDPSGGAIWIGGLAIIAALTLWSALAPELYIPWPYNGPVCGA